MAEQSSAAREPGFYWVRFTGDDGRPLPGGEPEIAQWRDGEWIAFEMHSGLSDKAVIAISPRLELPGSRISPSAFLKSWDEEGESGLRHRVDLTKESEPWLESKDPMIIPLYLVSSIDWPTDAKFSYGAPVQRADFPNGRPPAYRFPGTVCGWYRTPSGNLGLAISNLHEPACIQIFPQSGLEARP